MHYSYYKSRHVLNIDKKTVILFFATIIWMGVIFWFSSQPANDSAALSGELARIFRNLLNSLFGGKIPGFLRWLFFENQFFIRKAGHFMEYFILGLLVSGLIFRQNFKRKFLISVLICFFYAVSDEIHQMFVPGRGPMVTDVMLDTSGAFIAALLNLCRK
ncbi:MAG: VanZ family protein [Acetivibrionales bacterium]|jgi:VanZ family protein